MTNWPAFRTVGADGVLVEFGEHINDAVNSQVVAFNAAVERNPPPGLIEVIPAYASALVIFDPLTTDHHSVERYLRSLPFEPATDCSGRKHRIPICYDAEFAPDLQIAAEGLGICPEEFAARHLAAEYRVYMYGFAPGYAYLGGVPEVLHLARKPRPVRDVVPGSVVIAGAQCLITTLAMPTGWWIIGRSPARVFDPGSEQPFLFSPGDRVSFERIRSGDVTGWG